MQRKSCSMLDEEFATSMIQAKKKEWSFVCT